MILTTSFRASSTDRFLSRGWVQSVSMFVPDNIVEGVCCSNVSVASTTVILPYTRKDRDTVVR